MKVTFSYTLTLINPLMTFRIARKYWLRNSLFWYAINGPWNQPKYTQPWIPYKRAERYCEVQNKKYGTDKYSVGWCAERNKFEPQFRFSNGQTKFVHDLEGAIGRYFRSSLLHACREMGFLSSGPPTGALKLDDLLRVAKDVL